MYRQFDGYPEGHGKELYEFLEGYTILNGIPAALDTENGKYANGFGCLAAQLVAHFKNKCTVGGFYLTNEGDSQEYNYKIFPIKTNPQKIGIIIISGFNGKTIYDGSIDELMIKDIIE